MIKFHSEKENFYNETMKVLVDKKLDKLRKFGFKDFEIHHKIRKTGEHKVKLIVKDFVVAKQDNNFETALITAIKEVREMYLKNKS